MIWAVGIGPGDPELLTLKAAQLIETADVVAGFETVLKVVGHLIRGESVTLTYQTQFDALARVAAAHRAGRRGVVCFMGDPSFSGYQLLGRVEEACAEPVEVVPGISSAQVAAARARLPFDEAAFVSFHKRGDLERDKEYLVRVLAWGRNAIVIPRPWDFMPDAIAAFLIARGVPPGSDVTVFERLTADEAEWRGTLGDLSAGSPGTRFGDMSILVIRGGQAARQDAGGPESGRPA